MIYIFYEMFFFFFPEFCAVFRKSLICVGGNLMLWSKQENELKAAKVFQKISKKQISFRPPDGKTL